jgi:hypothetical protein
MAQSGSRDFNQTRQTIIEDALDIVGPDSPTNDQIVKAARSLNRMLKMWQAEGTSPWAIEWTTQTLTASDEVVGTDGNDYKCIRNHTSSSDNKPITGANYTTYWEATGETGSGGTWATSTAYTSLNQYALATTIIGVDEGAFVRNNGTDTQMTPLTRAEYLRLANKTSEGTPIQYWFDRQHTPQIYLYPFPDDTTDVIHLPVVRKLQDLDSQSDNPDLSEEWLMALVWGLAVEEAPKFGISVQEQQWLQTKAERYKNLAIRGTDDQGDLFIVPDTNARRGR